MTTFFLDAFAVNNSIQRFAIALKRRRHYGSSQWPTACLIDADDKSCIFHLEATDDALVGLYKEISTEITIHVNGQAIRQQSGSGILRIDPARGGK